MWDEREYGQLKQAITCLSRHKCTAPIIHAQAFDIFSYLMSSALMGHCNPDDLFRTTNMDTEQFRTRCDALQTLFDNFRGNRQFRQP
ncbi:hypothetical protein MSKU15_3135 [Komagataeibacter diospyri]|uniref:hypothetical protein n=1 Tax=Komagataeibacter diospyri TaxID=1932662 RepID=UPI0011347CB5|nr:hypothetical protein [Komagataeibacter diospyri]GCE91534.1 hypothetical protein MSKU15_3135 [Komagataeibacter diospyri]